MAELSNKGLYLLAPEELLREPWSRQKNIWESKPLGCEKALRLCVWLINFGIVYFGIRGKSAAGAILPLDEPDWLNCSWCDKDEMASGSNKWYKHNILLHANKNLEKQAIYRKIK